MGLITASTPFADTPVPVAPGERPCFGSPKETIDVTKESIYPYHPWPHLLLTPKLTWLETETSSVTEIPAPQAPALPKYAQDVQLSVERIPATASYPLRHAVLRPNQDMDSVVWPGDEEPGTTTFGAVEKTTGAVIGVATVFRDPAPFDPVIAGLGGRSPELEYATWRLRGMATRDDVQGQGIGTLVLGAVLRHVAVEGGRLLWCNARVGAIAFYERAGFSRFGEEWVLSTVGPHVVMWRRIETGGAR